MLWIINIYQTSQQVQGICYLYVFAETTKIISNSLQKFTYNTKKNHIFKVNFNFFLNYTLICQFKAYKLLLHIKSCK